MSISPKNVGCSWLLSVSIALNKTTVYIPSINLLAKQSCSHKNIPDLTFCFRLISIFICHPGWLTMGLYAIGLNCNEKWEEVALNWNTYQKIITRELQNHTII